MRVIAAVMVVTWHCFILLFYSEAAVTNTYLRALVTLLTLGHQAVVIFFVLSGFWVGGEVIKAFKADRFKWSEYMVRRVVRLWLVLIPVLFLSLLLGTIGSRAYPDAVSYGSKGLLPDAGTYQQTLGLTNFLRNLFFIQPDSKHYFALDLPLWSLSYEFWFYLWFPAMLAVVYAIKKRSSVFVVALNVVVLAAIVAFPVKYGRHEIIYFFPCYLLGALVFSIRSSGKVPAWLRNPKLSLAAMIVATYAARVLTRYGFDHKQFDLTRYSDWALSFFAAWLVLATWDKRLPKPLVGISGYARSTFSLYAIHVPLIGLIATALTNVERQTLDVRSVFYYLLLMGASLLAGYLLSQGTERWTVPVRKRVSAILRIGRPSTAGAHRA